MRIFVFNSKCARTTLDNVLNNGSRREKWTLMKGIIEKLD